MPVNALNLIVKVFIASAAIAVGLKTIGPQLAIPATTGVVIVLVLLPTVLLGIALGVQYRLQRR